MRPSLRTLLAVALFALVAAPALRAQATTGTIYGAVVDESKSILPGVTVQVKNIENGATRTLVTDENGRYRALNLPPGIYVVSAELPGFGPARRDNLTVEIGRDIVADLTMKVGGLPGVEAVKEFSGQTHDYSAEFGRAAGGVISAVTKSGTNGVHGTAFEFLRNSALDSPNFFDPVDPATGKQINPPFKRNQFGGTAGGPIVQNRIFYFGSY